jgi:hypothetical protein
VLENFPATETLQPLAIHNLILILPRWQDRYFRHCQQPAKVRSSRRPWWSPTTVSSPTHHPPWQQLRSLSFRSLFLYIPNPSWFACTAATSKNVSRQLLWRAAQEHSLTRHTAPEHAAWAHGSAPQRERLHISGLFRYMTFSCILFFKINFRKLHFYWLNYHFAATFTPHFRKLQN